MKIETKMSNCPNCGAPRLKSKCVYCGTWFINPEQIVEREYLYADDKVIDIVEHVRGSEAEG